MMRFLKRISKKSLRGKTVILRADFNVPFGKNGKIKDDFRIRMTIPTIKYLQHYKARIVIISHLGRPNERDAAFSLKPIADHLGRLLDEHIFFFDQEPKKLKETIELLPLESVAMLENIRFWPGEEKNDRTFARDLAKLGDIYVNDAFSVSHRSAASLVGVTKYLPSYAGLLLEKEIEALNEVQRVKKRPFGLIIGGTKIGDKLPMVEGFLKKADWVFVGGGVANTFLLAQRYKIGQSIKDPAYVKAAKRLLKQKKLIVPVDWVTGKSASSRSPKHYAGKSIARNEHILDIGLKSTALLREKIRRSRMVLWTGPVGYFENPKFASGSKAVAREIASNQRAFSVIGGGDTIAFFQKAIPNFEFLISKHKLLLSTGGGAMIEYLAGRKLPGVEALK